ncbi:hypothetical protein JCGZ_09206 [Jatropha curcas]|uniref:Germin-like protein n=1 Tax=Jatropha curcas TaxID=180498 RepID=A0A067KIS6_JATCU|nr:putative germin-like protein 2-1 [Jatropha curcas]KDP34918.1 hypothetical protein JCGZ_09206 [Jatropha curcas]
MASKALLLFLLLIALVCNPTFAFDNSPLQDFCVADITGQVRVNGFPCKDPKEVQADDFFFAGLHLPTNTSNPFGLGSNILTASQLPGLNTLGISLARVDFAPLGVSSPHIHPRATEVVTILEGTLEMGFVTSLPDNRLISKVLNKGDVFVVPPGLIHYARNPGKSNTAGIVAFSSQSPGFLLIPQAVFGSNHNISSDILAKSFQVDENVISQIRAKF